MHNEQKKSLLSSVFSVKIKVDDDECVLPDQGQPWDQCGQPVVSPPACLHPSSAIVGPLAFQGISIVHIRQYTQKIHNM